jgi:hypothetical protein
VEVIADPEAVEPGLLGQSGLLDQLGRRVFLTGQEVSDLHVVSPIA